MSIQPNKDRTTTPPKGLGELENFKAALDALQKKELSQRETIRHLLQENKKLKQNAGKAELRNNQKNILVEFYSHLCDIAVIDSEYRSNYDKKMIPAKYLDNDV